MDENIFAKLLFSSMLEIYFDIKFWVCNCVCVCIFFFGFISNFGELPFGTACVADVQFKGRGVKHYFINFLWLLLACNSEIIIIE